MHARCVPVSVDKPQPPLRTHLTVCVKVGLRVFEMPPLIENAADREIRRVIRFVNAKGVKVTEIRSQICRRKHYE